MGKQDKTNCMRVLDSKKIPYTPHLYEADPSLSGEEIARLLGEDPDRVFKTLVTVGRPQRYFVFVIPVNTELNRRKIRQHDSPEGASAADRLCTRRLLSHRNEKALPDVHSSERRRV